MKTLVKWKHPSKGEVVEAVCGFHQSRLLMGLRRLEIPHTREDVGDDHECGQCIQLAGSQPTGRFAGGVS